ncbi:hypothetical protein LTR05_002004 [Lithohypha guttulata]|uniref:Xylanolytic transcriptional activator regulatory domain-containing protein n=1 Tax=Lithohypha guttulata TaxID=1690604 RepID=A0AAN7T2U0_9EURO|nr:hypothetical protein LTR05_002004 [Lithohypha guttulata]
MKRNAKLWRRYLSTLEKRLAALEEMPDNVSRRSNDSSRAQVTDPGNISGKPAISIEAALIQRSLLVVNEDEASTETRHKISGDPRSSHTSQDLESNSTVPETRPQYAAENEPLGQASVEDWGLTNPLSAGPSHSGFISDATKGRSIYLGTSSNWSFSRRVLNAAHKATYGAPIGPENFALDGDIYSLDWDGSRVVEDDDGITLPSFNHALYLVSSVQFHIGEAYHVFHEEVFMPELHRFYEDISDKAQKRKLWYIHYLLIMAFGKAFTSRSTEKGKPPGVDLFVQAMRLLQDVSQLWIDPFTTAEIFCCSALYLQCADFRYGAYLTIGHAMRTALFQGMHTDLPAELFATSQIERARHIWWTVYILDKELSSFMGLPVQIADENINASLPTYSSNERAAALRLHIKLCRIVAQVVNTVYGPDGRLDKRFLTSTRSSLTSVASIAEELSKSIRLNLDDPKAGISRLAATLHLQYHHCIVLTTRPLLFSLFKKRLEAEATSSNIIVSIQRLRVLHQMCADSSERSLTILSVLQSQDLLAAFIPFDLESAFCSGIIALMASFLDPLLIDDLSAELEKVHRIIDDLTIKGNLIAYHRKAELEQLHTMLGTLQSRASNIEHSSLEGTSFVTLNASHDFIPESAEATFSIDTQATVAQPFIDWTWEDALDSAQLLNVADLLAGDQPEGFYGSFDW